MTQLAIGLVCSFLAILGLRVLFLFYRRWPAKLRKFEALLENNDIEEIRKPYDNLKTTYISIDTIKPFFWIGVIGLTGQGIYSLIVGLMAIL